MVGCDCGGCTCGANDLYEEDESIDEIIAAYEAGKKQLTEQHDPALD